MRDIIGSFFFTQRVRERDREVKRDRIQSDVGDLSAAALTKTLPIYTILVYKKSKNKLEHDDY